MIALESSVISANTPRMTNLKDLLSGPDVDMSAIQSHLNGLSHEARLGQCRALGRGAQRRLYDAAAGFQPLGLDFLVPSELQVGQEVVHHGKNSLPVFTHFAKVFTRPEGDDVPEGEIWGYNRGSSFIETYVGPGYFVAHVHDVEGELLVNYLRVPPRRPIEAWPPVLPNSARLSKFVYNGTQDILRGVSDHVSIGRATKGGKDMNAWFILCREPV